MPSPSPVVVVEIKPTYRCNQKCLFCLWERRKAFLPMTPEQVRGVLVYSLREIRPSEIVLSGGEPTIRSDFAQIISCIREHENLRTFHLHTNATRLDQHLDSLRCGVAQQHSATVGLHGHTPYVHDSITRSSGSFLRAVRGTRSLLEIGYDVRIACVICRTNQSYLPEITEFLLRLGAHLVEMRLPIPGEGQDLDGIFPSGDALRDALNAWYDRFSDEPRARLMAADARCFGTVSFRTEESRAFHFFDGQAKPGKESVAPSQLQAIWPAAYDYYRKSRSCAGCVFDEVCRGYSKEETRFGAAKYVPIEPARVLEYFERTRASGVSQAVFCPANLSAVKGCRSHREKELDVSQDVGVEAL